MSVGVVGQKGLRPRSLEPKSKDLLHVFHQGVLCVVIAALVCNHIECLYPAITLKELDQVLSKQIYKHYRAWCHQKGKAASACSHRFSGARFGKEQWSAFPELGSIYKAAVVKSMLFWCNDFIKESVGRVVGAEARHMCVHAFAKFQYLVDISGPFFEPQRSKEVAKYCRAGLLFYQQLAANDRARADDRRCFKIIPKCHSLFELSLYIELTNRNPRFFVSNYGFFVFSPFNFCFSKKQVNHDMIKHLSQHALY